MKVFIIFLVCFFLTNCNEKARNIILPEKITGCWKLTTNEINYPELEFSDTAYCVFGSRGDTIYYFSYSLKADTLVLIDDDGKVTNNLIETLNDSELVFKNLIIHSEKQEYIRCKSSR